MDKDTLLKQYKDQLDKLTIQFEQSKLQVKNQYSEALKQYGMEYHDPDEEIKQAGEPVDELYPGEFRYFPPPAAPGHGQVVPRARLAVPGRGR